MERKKLSVFILTYNEEKKIRECIESVLWADEVVVIDSFSTDRTVEISRGYTDKVFQVKFEGFGKLRNYALSRLSHDWVLSIDSDERSTDELKEAVLKKLSEGPDAAAYLVPRKNYFFGRWIKHSGWYPDYRQPQFFDRTKMKYRQSDLVHETYELVAGARLSRLDAHAVQIPFLSLSEFLAKMDRYSTLRSRQMYNEGKRFRLWQIVTHPASCFLRMYLFKLGFLDGKRGFLLALLYTYYTLIKYAKFWEIGFSAPPAGNASDIKNV